MRKWTLALGLAITTSLLAADASAYTKEELSLEKAEVKYAKGVSKSVGKLAKKWHKNADKGKDNAEIEKELKVYYRNELSWLREKGIPTVEEPEPMQHPAHPVKVMPEPPSETPKLEALRDLVVTLKQGELKDKAMGKKLDEYVSALDARYERKNKRYKEHKKE